MNDHDSITAHDLLTYDGPERTLYWLGRYSMIQNQRGLFWPVGRIPVDAHSLARCIRERGLPTLTPPIQVGDVIETRDDLDRLPDGTILRGQYGEAWRKDSGGWRVTGVAGSLGLDATTPAIWAPLTVLYVGGDQ